MSSDEIKPMSDEELEAVRRVASVSPMPEQTIDRLLATIDAIHKRYRAAITEALMAQQQERQAIVALLETVRLEPDTAVALDEAIEGLRTMLKPQ